MIRSRKVSTFAALTLGLASFWSASARADLEFIYESALSNQATGVYVYSVIFNSAADPVTMTATQAIDAGGVVYPRQPSGTGTSVQSFATLYDVTGITSVTLNPTYAADFTVSQQLVGITPANVNPPDNPGLMNVTLSYIGPQTGSDTSFTQALTINSNFHQLNPNGFYSSRTTKATGGSAGDPIAAVGNTTVPGIAVPEPSSVALMGIGAIGALGLALRRRMAV